MSLARHATESGKEIVELSFDPVSQRNTVFGNSLPDFEQIVLRFRRDFVERPVQARFCVHSACRRFMSALDWSGEKYSPLSN